MSSAKLTKSAIEAMPLPAKGRVTLWDKTTAGLCLRISESGARTWSYVYRSGSRLRRLTLGRYDGTAGIPPDEARKLAVEAAQAVRAGRDPAAERRMRRGTLRTNAPAAATVAAVAEEYLRVAVHPKCRPGTYAEYARALRQRLIPALGHRLARDVTRTELRALMQAEVERGSPVAANRLHSVLRSMLNWWASEDEGFVSPFAARAIKKPANEISRDRVMKFDELRLMLRTLPRLGRPWSALFHVLMLTGQRRGEVASMRWCDVDLDRAEWNIPRAVAKNKSAHFVPLSAQVVAILRAVPVVEKCQFVFTTTGTTPPSGFSRAVHTWDGLMKAENDGQALPDWRLHDLRRTVASVMACELGVQPMFISAVLNHRPSNVLGGVTAVYVRTEFRPQRRAALDAWADFLATLKPAP